MKKRSEDKSNKRIVYIFFRYLILLVLVFTLPIIYSIFTPLTIYPVSFLLKLFFHSVILSQNFVDSENMIILAINSNTFIQIIPACIAGSAYLLLLILNLTVPMDFRKRIYSILLSFGILLLLNMFRIVFFTILYYNKFIFFDFTHKLFWYVLSTIFVILIWFFVVRKFSIKEIPVYTDIKYLTDNTVSPIN